MEQKCVHFEQLSLEELYKILQLRMEIFVVEQTCYYQDADGLDMHPKTLHNLFYKNGELAAYTRILAPGVSYPEYASIGRIVVSTACRGEKLGHKIVEQSIRTAFAHWPHHAIKISAQAHLEKFYQSHGFKVSTEPYLEDGIPHIGMILEHSL